MKTVPLHGKKAAGRVALVDDEDYELVMQHRWHLIDRPARPNWGPYAQTWIWRGGKRARLRMHQLIAGYPGADHADTNGLNDQRANLRPAANGQNQADSRPQRGKTSRFKGVSWAYQGYWRADIRVKMHNYNLGYHKTEEAATRAYDAAALAAWGEYARLNFPGHQS